jgi:hypothetical protein
MNQRTHVLIGLGEAKPLDPIEFRGERHGDGPWLVRMRTMHGGRSEAVQVVEINNGAMSIDVLPTRGMGIWRVRRGDTTLGWNAPAGQPVHPSFVRLMEPAGLGWLDGFCELLCRCGLESNGPPEFDDAGRLLRPLHGRIANTPAHRVDLLVGEDSNRLTLRGVVDESRFHFQSLRLTSSISTSVGSNEFTWSDEVENIGGRDATLQMLYHFNIGQPLLKPGSRITAPLGMVAPLTKIAAEEGIATWNVMPQSRPGSAEQVYVLDLAADSSGNTGVLVSDLSNNEAVSLRFNKATLPCFTVWRNSPAESDGYVLGIEPGTNYPNPRSFEMQHNRVVELKTGARWRAEIAAKWLSDDASIKQEEAAIEAIQAASRPELVCAPRPGWSASAG